MTDLENNQATNNKQQTKKAGPRRLALAQPQKWCDRDLKSNTLIFKVLKHFYYYYKARNNKTLQISIL